MVMFLYPFGSVQYGPFGHGGGTENLVQKWLRPEELEHYPLSSTGRKLAGLV